MKIIVLATSMLTASVLFAGGASAAGAAAEFDRAAVLDAEVPAVIKARRVAGAGIAIIHGGRVVWTGYYGEQGPNKPVTRETMFNTASLAKSITAETVLRLVAMGKVSLDEPIAAYFVHPDLAADPRYRQLTPRLILSHQSGLLNWAYMYKDKKLAFVSAPGARFGYSGAAYNILARFLEKKLNADFETLVADTVFKPIGMSNISMKRQKSIDSRVTTPMNGDGVYEAPYTTGQPDWHNGGWSAASDLFVTVDDYAKYMISMLRGEGLTPALMAERLRLHSSFVAAPEWECVPQPSLVCPDRYGFALGWIVFQYGSTKLVWGGGNDSGENAMVYFTSEAPGDAVMVFVNGGNGVYASVDIIELIDKDQKLVPYIRQLIDRHARG